MNIWYNIESTIIWKHCLMDLQKEGIISLPIYFTGRVVSKKINYK
jgi:hypothetical protein